MAGDERDVCGGDDGSTASSTIAASTVATGSTRGSAGVVIPLLMLKLSETGLERGGEVVEYPTTRHYCRLVIYGKSDTTPSRTIKSDV